MRLFSALLVVALLAANCGGAASASRGTGPDATSQATNPQAARIAAEMRTGAGGLAVLEPRGAALELGVAVLATRYQGAEDAIRQHDIRTKAYMMNRKMASAVILAGGGSLAKLPDSNNNLSKEDKDVLIGLSAAVLVWALFNAEEVGAVGDALLQAASHDQELRAAAGQVKEQWDKQAAERDAAVAGYETAKNRLAMLRATL